MGNKYGPPERGPSRISIGPEVPENYRDDLDLLFQYGSEEDRYFIARGWLTRPLDDGSLAPTPVAWILSATSLGAAQLLSDTVRHLLEQLWPDEEHAQLAPSAVQAIWDLLARRVLFLTLTEAESVLHDLGIPLYLDANFNTLSETFVMAFCENTGFSSQNLERYAGHIPAVIL